VAATRDRLVARLHAGALVLVLALYATSPWLAMLKRVPRSAGVVDYAHLVVGALLLAIALAWLALGARGGRWRLWFPWASGRFGAVRRDLAGLLRGRLPATEGGGLNSALQGLALLALLVAAATGAGWFVAQGGEAALAWRAWHATSAHVLGGLVIAHALAALSHVLDFAR
jgi:cytochrome b561